ncbi:GNAT family N-acetyltransferase [Lentzea sp. BCCO 10_0798]|uniref:GNAT family N-acetyltransferase n=1 Tax=Lentzea kristufekii TaxID=3095430 RepID=A0ABU4U5E2_9PSEU|nr:GNAT family N-acetyltransferase [Lentzea sp. BCCO 10_0798]MDX8055795.1 GNAT family N-acetyltransferase [Lentzea sp. BCCO 10_0798]
MLRPDYPITTARLLLRPFQPGDLDDVVAYRGLPEVNRYLFSEPYARAEAEENLAKWIALREITAEGQWLTTAVTLDGRVIGEVDITLRSEEHRQGEVGYIFHPAFQGRGYAREATEAMLKIGFEEFGLHRIVAECDVRNEPSWRLMERLGMRREAHLRHHGIFKGEWADCFVYAMLAGEHRNH